MKLCYCKNVKIKVLHISLIITEMKLGRPKQDQYNAIIIWYSIVLLAVSNLLSEKCGSEVIERLLNI